MSKKQSATESTSKQTRRTFTQEFKQEAVNLVADQGYKVAEAARNLGVSVNSLHLWIKQFSEQEESSNSTIHEENKQLRKEVKRLRMERDISKKATPPLAV